MEINEIVKIQEWSNLNCGKCGRMLINPGYGKQYSAHCNALWPWGEWVTQKYRKTGDTGRDVKGRFSGRKIIKWERCVD